MATTFKTIIALAVLCAATPAFAHGGGGHGGGGHGGMGSGGNGQHSGHSMSPMTWNVMNNTAGQHNSHSTSPMTWNIMKNTTGQQNGHSTSPVTGNKLHHTVGRHHDRKFKINLVRHEEHIKRLRLEASQLATKIEHQLALNHRREVARLQRELRRIVRELKNEGATII